MRGSSVTAARSCLQPLVSANRYLAVHALPGDPLYFIVDVKSKVKDVYAKTCQLLGQQGMQDCELFGLAILSDGEYLFVDPESKLSKYAPKNWRSSHTYGLDSSGRPAFILYFRVRYYVASALLLSDDTTRHHYYLQLRDNVVRHGGGVEENWQGYKFQHPLQSSNVYGPLLSLAGLALQADFGDYNDDRRLGSLCKPSDYLPAHMCHEENVASVLAAHHKDNRGLSREEAELSYIKEAILLEAPLNAHLYRLRRSKNEQGPGRVLLAICARGVRVYADEDSPQTYAWSKISKLGFDRKKFEIRMVDQPSKFTLFSGCDDKSKLLLAHCRDTHQFSMAIAPRVVEAKRQEEEERKVMRDMYPARCKLNSLGIRSSMRADQRISLISSTSSNTTSGIVSDRAVHSEDEPDLAAAIPPTVPAAGSHLDKTGTINRKHPDDDASMMPPPPAPPTSMSSRDPSSSNCSTVVVASPPPIRKQPRSSSPAARVALVSKLGGTTSTRSSFEFTSSRTARNSPLDPCAELLYDGCNNKSLKYAELGSETSGVYTLQSSEMLAESLTNDSSVQSTTDEASVTSGFYTIHSGLDDEHEPIYSICREEDMQQQSQNQTIDSSNEPISDRVELDHDQEQTDGAGRPRSNSILSVGSFRGDGSDPAADQGPLLSADELSDLIVGRCYPPRKSVGISMDSACDYVRMPPPPLPPAPPPRSDSERQLPPPPPYPGNSILVSAHQHQQQQQQQLPPPPPPPSYTCPRERFEIPPPTPPRNDAVTPREPPPPPPPPLSRIKPPTYPGDKMKPLPVHAPVAALVVGPNNYLDVHATRTGPVLLPYLSPPPPPPPPAPAQQQQQPQDAATSGALLGAGGLATVYTSQVARTQIEQYQQQLYSDVDYVIYPLKDPALSQQEYIDAKQGSMLAAMAAAGYHHHQVAPPPPPPPYPDKSSLMYRSTPYLASGTPTPGSSSLSSFSCNRYASNQNLATTSSLSDTNSSVGGNNYFLYGGLAGSHYTASTGSLYSGYTGFRRDDNRVYASPPPPPPPLPPTTSRRVLHSPSTSNLHQQPRTRVPRTRSHDNILESCYEAALASPLKTLSLSRGAGNVGNANYKTALKHRRLPPPPPPPPYDLQSLPSKLQVCLDDSKDEKSQQEKKEEGDQPQLQQQQQSQSNEMLDIKTLREKSKNLDLPLISALCNDRYLLRQTKAFVLPKHPTDSTASCSKQNGTSSSLTNGAGGSSSSRQKYPVSGLSTTQINKPPRKTTNSTHKHPSMAMSFARSSKDLGNIYRVNSSSATMDKKNLSRASHS